jgi:peptidoglycan/LPS O-acetylase OafA/YrhL
LKSGITRFYSLDILRGLAAVSVVLHHWNVFYRGIGQQNTIENLPFFGWISVFYTRGNLAVDLFFCLSGFVFYCIYSKNVANGVVSASKFAWLRLSRLYPLHFLTLVIVALCQGAFFKLYGHYFCVSTNDINYFALNLFFLQSWGFESSTSFNVVTWSLSVEIFAYILFFLLCRIFQAKVIVMLVVVFCGFLLEHRYEPLGRGLVSFFMGGIAFLLYQKISSGPCVFNIGRWLSVTMISAWSITLIEGSPGVTIFPFLESSEHIFSEHLIAMWAVVWLFPLTVLSLALLEPRYAHIFRRFVLLGDLSYSIYLWHFSMQLAFYVAATHYSQGNDIFYSPWFMAAFFAVLMPLSWVSYHYFELPMQRVLRRSVKFRKTAEKQNAIGAYSEGS